MGLASCKNFICCNSRNKVEEGLSSQITRDFDEIVADEAAANDVKLGNLELAFYDETTRLAEIRGKTMIDPMDFVRDALLMRLKKAVNFDKHKLVFEGFLYWCLTPTTKVRVRGVLLDGVLLLLREDKDGAKYVLKSHRVKTKVGSKNITIRQRPILNLESSCLTKWGLKSIFICEASNPFPHHLQMELAEDRDLWWSRIKGVVQLVSN